MAKIWKWVLILALLLLVGALLLGGAGLLTGASPARVWALIEAETSALPPELAQLPAALQF